MNLYQGIYGELEYDEGKEQHVLSEYDEDKGFFDFLKPKNDNNDFNNEQLRLLDMIWKRILELLRVLEVEKHRQFVRKLHI
ncbi:hypothetical protein P9X17_31010 [Bacillus cereus]|nr:hypothetical protein [Bacillus cereus]